MKSKYIVLLAIVLFFSSCNKEWLDIKRDKKLVVPSSYQDLQALLDFSGVMNESSPFLGLISADDHYITSEKWQSLTSVETKNAYIWEEEIYEGGLTTNYTYPYQSIFYANLVLEGIEKLNDKPSEQEQWSNIKGSALFYRAWAFFNIALTFCTDYDVNTARDDLGISLKLNSYVEDIPNRSSLYDTYEKIIEDLSEALLLVSKYTSIKTRPNKSAVYAMLARVYLYMKEYKLALLYAEKALEENQNVLLDYNKLNSEDAYPFKLYNDEVIFQARMISSAIQNSGTWIVDSILYNSFDKYDLRKGLFFDNLKGFKGSYNEDRYFFCGLAIDEMYLIVAECEARSGSLQNSINSLNILLKNRYEYDNFEPLQTSVKEQVLKKVLFERRKQLIYRGLRWADLKRLNKEPLFKKILVRDHGSTSYTLMPNDPRYVFALPDEVIRRNGMVQNSR